MIIPNFFEDNFVDNFFDDLFQTPTNPRRDNMRTNIIDLGDSYRIEVEVPGFKKEELSIELQKGNLTIKASKGAAAEEGEEVKYIRRERTSEDCQRTFFIGKKVEQEDIRASFSDGVLTLAFPKETKKEPEKHFIDIQG